MSKTGPGNIGGQARPQLPDSLPVRQSAPRHASAAAGTRLQAGALVRATLLQSPMRGRAAVQLPTGSVEAVVQADSLRRGDTVLFRVQEAGERLVLRVEGVPAAQLGAQIDSADILRILGRPVNKLDLAIVDFLRGQDGGTVKGETVQELHAAVRRLVDNVDLSRLEPVLQTINKLRALQLPVEATWFNRLHPLFADTQSYARDLTTLRELARGDEPAVRSLGEQIQSALGRSRASISGLMRFFAMPQRSGEQQNMYNILREFVRGAAARPPSAAVSEAVRLAEGMLDSMEAQRLHNWRAAEQSGALLFSLALPLGEELLPARVEVQTRSAAEGGDGSAHFRVSSDLSALGPVSAGGTLQRRMLSLTILAADEARAAILEAESEELLQSLRSADYIIRAFAVRVADAEGGDGGIGTSPRSVDIVV